MSRAKSNWLRAFNKVRMQLQEVSDRQVSLCHHLSTLGMETMPTKTCHRPHTSTATLHNVTLASRPMGRSLPGLSWPWPYSEPLALRSLATVPSPGSPSEAWTFPIRSEQNWRPRQEKPHLG